MPTDHYALTVKEVWAEYDLKAKGRLRLSKPDENKRGAFRLLFNRNAQIREIVGELEESVQFRSLVGAVRADVMARGYHKGGESFWDYAVKHGLRRSGYYLRIADDVCESSVKELRLLLDAFAQRTETATHLAPMEYVSLDISQINCKGFQIRSFDKAELDELLKNPLREVHYPWAVVDTACLSSYSFIVLNEKREISPLGRIPGDLGSVGKVASYHPPYPALERALQRLALFDWQPDWTRYESKEKREDW